jgi:membrane-bound lytic murein transglycosylase F
MRYLFLFVISVISIVSCTSSSKAEKKEISVKKTVLEEDKTDYVTGIDLKEIKERGVLKVLTIHSPSSYFIYKGKSFGFEYELLQNFADEIGVKFKVVKVHNLNEVIPMLCRGEGDLIAQGLTITKDRKKIVDFTDFYYLTQQVLVQRKPDKWWNMHQDKIDKQLIKDVVGLIGDTVTIRKESSYYKRIQNLNSELGGTIHVEFIDGSYSTEEIIKMVSDGKIKYTIADNNIAEINKSYYSNLDVSTKISLSQRVAWTVRKDSPELKEAANKWLKKIKKSGYYNIVYKKYFGNKRRFKKVMKSDYYSVKSDKISEYDKIIKRYSKNIGWDWRLVSSVVYQESRFNHHAVSWVGASGLMQLMPSTAKELGVKNNTPEENIKAGTKYLSNIFNKFRNVEDTIQRIKFTLASYNCGFGHIIDAQKLAKKYGEDENSWDNGVSDFILKLSEPKYYNQDIVKYGYVRGIEPYTYVEEIFDRFENYKQFIE